MKLSILVTILCVLGNTLTGPVKKISTNNQLLCMNNKCRDKECIKNKEYCHAFETPTGNDCECAKFKDASSFCENNICHNTFCNLEVSFCNTFKNINGNDDCECKPFPIIDNMNTTTQDSSSGMNTNTMNSMNSSNSGGMGGMTTGSTSSNGMGGMSGGSSMQPDSNTTNSTSMTATSGNTNLGTNNINSMGSSTLTSSNNGGMSTETGSSTSTSGNESPKLCVDQTCGMEKCTNSNKICIEYPTSSNGNQCQCVANDSKCSGLDLNTCNDKSCGDLKCVNALIADKADCACVSKTSTNLCGNGDTCKEQACAMGNICKNIGLAADSIECKCVENQKTQKEKDEEGKCLGEKKDTCNGMTCSAEHVCTEFVDKKTCDCVKKDNQFCTGTDKNYCNAMSCGDETCEEFKEGDFTKCRCAMDKTCKAGKCKGINCEVDGGSCATDSNGECFCNKLPSSAVSATPTAASATATSASASASAASKKIGHIEKKFKKQKNLD